MTTAVRANGLARETELHRFVAQVCLSELELGYGTEVTLRGLRAAGSMLARCAEEWRLLEQQWDEHHDLLVLGVGL